VTGTLAPGLEHGTRTLARYCLEGGTETPSAAPSTERSSTGPDSLIYLDEGSTCGDRAGSGLGSNRE
jgi:hypothetical protein